MAPSADLKISRGAIELVAPAKPTPFQVLKLSELDQEDSLRTILPALQFYNYNPSMKNVDPVVLLREALSRTLVFYYPFAGRLRESPEDKGKMVVECNDEGATFVEAKADITIKELGTPLHPPFPYLYELVPPLPGSEYFPDLFNSSLLYIQVTRMKCGGFIVGSRISNNLADGSGCVQLLRAFSDIARGLTSPSVLPVWKRELLCEKDPPKVLFDHHELEDKLKPVVLPNIVHRMIYFTDKEVSTLRKLAPDHLKKSTSFELLATCLWRTRALALQLNPEEIVRLGFAMNARNKYEPPLPKGYYGNAIAYVAAASSAKDLYEKPFGHTLEKVIEAKRMVTDEYMRSFAYQLEKRGQPSMLSQMPAYFITDFRRLGYNEIDYGWGEPLYGGPGIAFYALYSHLDNMLIKFKNEEGEDMTLSVVCLQKPNMEIFVEELYKLIGTRGVDPFNHA